MPENAAATGLVDFVLKPDQIPRRLHEIAMHRDKIENENWRQSRQDEIASKLNLITALIADQGQDFSDYKPGTLVRRIERRMMILRQRTVDGFINRLKCSPKRSSLPS